MQSAVERQTDKLFYTTKEVSERIGVSMRSIYQYCATEGLPYIVIKKRFRIPRQQYLDWERKHLKNGVDES